MPSDDDVRAGYEVAVNLWIYEGGQNWARFNVMLVVHTIIIGGVFALSAGEAKLPFPKMAVPIAGLLLSVLWFQVMERGFQYQDYYVRSARELEARIPGVEVVSRGGAFSDGESVEIRGAGDASARRMKWTARIIRARWASQVVILLFAVAYVWTLVNWILC